MRLALLGAGLVLSLAVLGLVPGARRTPLPGLGLWTLAFGFYVAGAGVLIRGGGRAGDGRPRRRIVGMIWTTAVAGRLALLFLDPHLSDDIWRYLWDGHVQLQGVNPYLHAPAEGALASIRTSWHGLINHPSVPTIYPPGAQLAFAALAAVGARALVFKVAWTAADLATGWILGRIARDRGMDVAPVLLLYLWCPLLMVEVGWSGHLAPLGLLPMMGAIWLSEKGRTGTAGEAGSGPEPALGPALAERGSGGAGALLAAASAVKFAPAAGLPALIRKHGWSAGAAFLVAAGILAAPYLDAGPRLWAGLAEYVERWSFHPGPFRLVEGILGAGAAKAVVAAAVAGLALRAARERWTLERALFWTVGAGLLLTPTLQPWYLLWILPFAALRRRPGWILFTGTAFLSYAHLDVYLSTGRWPQPLWLTLLIWVPPLAVMGWSLLAGPGADRAAGPDPADPVDEAP